MIIAVHHLPYSLDTKHGGYPGMEIGIDRMIGATGRVPTMVLSGHIHSYQRFDSKVESRKNIPYVVSGAGGHADSRGILHKIEPDENGLIDSI